ncbi:hypothetical protein HDU93_008884 [Gonapodya sp. JEL0774]|nr:hypothetical protein HDU93_008884 [Gonapodya sp. JEL0774]
MSRQQGREASRFLKRKLEEADDRDTEAASKLAEAELRNQQLRAQLQTQAAATAANTGAASAAPSTGAPSASAPPTSRHGEPLSGGGGDAAGNSSKQAQPLPVGTKLSMDEATVERNKQVNIYAAKKVLDEERKRIAEQKPVLENATVFIRSADAREQATRRTSGVATSASDPHGGGQQSECITRSARRSSVRTGGATGSSPASGSRQPSQGPLADGSTPTVPRQSAKTPIICTISPASNLFREIAAADMEFPLGLATVFNQNPRSYSCYVASVALALSRLPPFVLWLRESHGEVCKVF